MIENTIMKKNREGKKANVFGLTYPSLNLVELAAHAGFDAINCDGEHGLFSPESLDDICRVANGYGMSVTARVPDKSPYWINLYLDRGIQGIVGPHVESKKEAQEFADACLFPTFGKRSWGGGRGTEFNDDQKISEYGGKLEFAKWTNKNMLVIAQIESVPGWDNLEEILIPGEPDNTKRQQLTSEIESKARKNNKIVQDDIMRTLSIQELMIDGGRKFISEGQK